MTYVEAGIVPIETAHRQNNILYIYPSSAADLWDKAIRHTFRDNGYTEVSVTPGMPLLTGQSIFGLGVYTEEMWHGKQKDLLGLHEAVSEVADIKMPERYSTIGALQEAQLPIMVKPPAKHRGEGKILVESEEDKRKVIAFVLAYEKIRNILSTEPSRRAEIGGEIQAVLRESFASINGRALREEEIQTEIPRELVAQKFVETPGDNYASLRVVVDATGQDVYSAIFYAPKNPRRRLFNMQRRLPFEDAVKAAATHDYNIISFLLSEESPVYVKSKSAISNVSRGGKKFVLGEGPARDKSLRKTLSLIGIDPDNPKVPATLLEKARIVGKEFRMVAPFVAEDFIIDQYEEGKLLEVNTYPGVTSMVGHKPGVYTEYDAYKYIVRKMLERVGQDKLT